MRAQKWPKSGQNGLERVGKSRTPPKRETVAAVSRYAVRVLNDPGIKKKQGGKTRHGSDRKHSQHAHSTSTAAAQRQHTHSITSAAQYDGSTSAQKPTAHGECRVAGGRAIRVEKCQNQAQVKNTVKNTVKSTYISRIVRTSVPAPSSRISSRVPSPAAIHAWNRASCRSVPVGLKPVSWKSNTFGRARLRHRKARHRGSVSGLATSAQHNQNKINRIASTDQHPIGVGRGHRGEHYTREGVIAP